MKKTLWPELPPQMTISASIKRQDRYGDGERICYPAIRCRTHGRTKQSGAVHKEFPITPDNYRDQMEAAKKWMSDHELHVPKFKPPPWKTVVHRMNISVEVVKRYQFKDLREV